MDFNVKGQLSGTITPKHEFQPVGSQPELFASLGNVKIPVPKEVNKPVSHSESMTSKPNINNVTVKAPSSSSHNYQADIEQAVAVIKSKATISVDGVQWELIVDLHPDAEVPDRFGGMLYAWNVILDGNAQQIYFFDNNRYIGKNTANYHLLSSVQAGSAGTIIATYQHYLANDIMASPTGQPFTACFIGMEVV